MDYSIVLSDQAVEKLQQLPPEILAAIPEQFSRLAAHPATLSFPGAPPASLPNRQIYAFPIELSHDRKFTVRIHFRYGQDEMTLFVIHLSAIQHSGPENM